MSSTRSRLLFTWVTVVLAWVRIGALCSRTCRMVSVVSSSVRPSLSRGTATITTNSTRAPAAIRPAISPTDTRAPVLGVRLDRRRPGLITVVGGAVDARRAPGDGEASAEPRPADDHPDAPGARTDRLLEPERHLRATGRVRHHDRVLVGRRGRRPRPAEGCLREGLGDRGRVSAPRLMALVHRLLQLRLLVRREVLARDRRAARAGHGSGRRRTGTGGGRCGGRGGRGGFGGGGLPRGPRPGVGRAAPRRPPPERPRGAARPPP